jgi:hypothetical protein
MNHILRVAVVVCTVALAVCGLNEIQPDWPTEMRPAWLDLSELQSQLKRESQNARRLEKREQLVLSCIEAKRQLVEDLVGGRLTLLEAAARFRDLHRLVRNDAVMGMFRQLYPGDSDEGRYCHQVIWAVQNRGPSPSGKAAAAVARLKKEFEEETACGRPICLP